MLDEPYGGSFADMALLGFLPSSERRTRASLR
jgi:hypothetical protein